MRVFTYKNMAGILLVFFLSQTTVAQEGADFELSLPEEVPCLRCGFLSDKMGAPLKILWHMSSKGASDKRIEQWIPSSMRVDGDKVWIDILVNHSSPATWEKISQSGGKALVHADYLGHGWVDIFQLPVLCELTEIKRLRPAYLPLTSSGNVKSQGDQAQNSQLARSSFGLDGTGVKIGVLSDSYDNLGGANQGVLDGELPGTGNPNNFTSPVQVVQDLGGGGSDEGRGMIELIHDVAPASEIAFATAFNGIAGFANNILALRAVNCDVIVDDVRFFASPFFQDGIISQAVDSVVSTGAVFFSAAGNQGRDSYENSFQPSGNLITVNFGITNITYETHDFGGGDIFQQISIPSGEIATLVLQWEDDFASVSGGGGAISELDFFLVNNAGTSVLAQSTNINVGGDPVEILQFQNLGNSTTFNLLIASEQGIPLPGRIKTISFSPSVSFNEFDTNSSTLFGQANASGAIAVGASFWGFTPAFGTSPPLLESFSSFGGTPILFDTNGNSIPPITRSKPEITAPDGGNTSFFGDDIGFDADNLPNFFGTSAAAPHAAGVAALMLEANPTLSPQILLNTLQTTAIDILPLGFDSGSGAGLINANQAVQNTLNALPVTFIDFLVRTKDHAASLTWIVSHETALKGYEIILKADDSKEVKREFISARNLNRSKEIYETTLTSLPPGEYRVQLKAIDLDGSETYAPLRRLKIDDLILDFWLSFSSSSQRLRVRPSFPTSAMYQLDIYDLSGREIRPSMMLNGQMSEVEFSLPEYRGIGIYRIRQMDGKGDLIREGKILLPAK